VECAGAWGDIKLYDDDGRWIPKLKNRLELYALVADFLDKFLPPDGAVGVTPV
jgi:hypothetical protein